MIVKPVDNMIQLVRFLANPENTAALVDDGDVYALKPDALYVGIYDGDTLAGVHEVRQFWQNVVECHCIYGKDYRGSFALFGHRLFCCWLLENNPFTNSVTMVPDHTRQARSILALLGATRIGRMDAAYYRNGVPVPVTLYQLTRAQYEELAK